MYILWIGNLHVVISLQPNSKRSTEKEKIHCQYRYHNNATTILTTSNLMNIENWPASHTIYCNATATYSFPPWPWHYRSWDDIFFVLFLLVVDIFIIIVIIFFFSSFSIRVFVMALNRLVGHFYFHLQLKEINNGLWPNCVYVYVLAMIYFTVRTNIQCTIHFA